MRRKPQPPPQIQDQHPFNNPEFNKLREVWYRKLERTGFEDAERDDYKIKNPSFNYAHIDKRRKFTMEQAHIYWAAKHEYYYLANQFLHSHKFKNPRERNIWEYHSNGIGIRSIVKTINKVSSSKTTKDIVWKTLKRLQKIMKDLNLKK